MEPLEVGGDDGDGEREHQHPRHRAHAAEQLAQARPGTQVDIAYTNTIVMFSRGRDVPVADSGHGHHHPVDPSGY